MSLADAQLERDLGSLEARSMQGPKISQKDFVLRQSPQCYSLYLPGRVLWVL